MKKRMLSLLLTFVMVLGLLPAAALAAPEADVKTAAVTLTLEQDNFYLVGPQTVTVSQGLSDQYGYVDQVTDGVSVLDALIAAHELKLGNAFTPETCKDVLVVDEYGFITKVMAIETQAIGFAVNGMAPNDGDVDSYGTYTAYTSNQAEIVNSDVVQFFFYNPEGYMGEVYTNFVKDEQHITTLHAYVGQQETLSVAGYSFIYEGVSPNLKWKPVAGAQVCTLAMEGENKGSLVPITGAVTGEDGSFTVSFDRPGTYSLAVTSNPDKLFFTLPQILTVTVDYTEDQKAAMAVEALIAKLPDPITLESKEAIEAARKAYDALTEDQKQLVTNYDKLVKDEQRYEEMTAPEPIKPSAPQPGIEYYLDVDEDDWFYAPVVYVTDNGLMSGVGNRLFAPNATLTRGMVVTILYRLEGEPAAAAANGFTDVAADQWYTDAVRWAASSGVVNGISDTAFAPNASITREQMAAMLLRYAEYKGYDASASGSLEAFEDVQQVSSWAVKAIRWACAEGLLNGRTAVTIAPQGSATRAEAAAILMRFAEQTAK